MDHSKCFLNNLIFPIFQPTFIVNDICLFYYLFPYLVAEYIHNRDLWSHPYKEGWINIYFPYYQFLVTMTIFKSVNNNAIHSLLCCSPDDDSSLVMLHGQCTTFSITCCLLTNICLGWQGWWMCLSLTRCSANLGYRCSSKHRQCLIHSYQALIDSGTSLHYHRCSIPDHLRCPHHQCYLHCHLHSRPNSHSFFLLCIQIN